jgi:hypothetical protein
MRMLAIAGVFAMGLSLIAPAAAATHHAADAVVLTWEQCHIQTLRQGYNPYRRAYVRRMFHCLDGSTAVPQRLHHPVP